MNFLQSIRERVARLLSAGDDYQAKDEAIEASAELSARTGVDRRVFLRALGMGAVGAVVAHSIPTIWTPDTELITPMGFCVPIEWTKLAKLTSASSIALQLEKVQDQIPLLFEDDAALERILRNRRKKHLVSVKRYRLPMCHVEPSRLG